MSALYTQQSNSPDWAKMTKLIEFSAITEAAERLNGKVIRTATIPGPKLTEKLQRPVFLKLENTQMGVLLKHGACLTSF